MKKKLLMIGFVCILLLGVCFGIGNYFVSYALSPTSSSDQRNVDGEVELSFEEAEDEATQLGDAFSQQTSIATLQSQDGLTLQGYYACQEESHLWGIMIHGYKSDSQAMMSYGAKYYEHGYNVLLPDNRAHGQSEGDYIGMGWLDKDDIEKWIEWIIARDSQAQIILHGVSMGGATTMMVSGDNPDHVIGYIEDCGYTSVWDIFASELSKRFSLPTFPVLDISNLYASVFAGYDFKEASSLEQVKKCEMPMLFIHGDRDDFVPTEMVYQVYEAATCEKALYVVEGAGHAQSRNKNPEEYWEHVFQFIHEKILPENE